MAGTSMKGCFDMDESMLFNVEGRDVDFSLILDNP